ncbi:carboxylesterase family protein [Sphingomonas sp.]|uniref:carboxylesterase/lipase family protein n=1 Tax=Sphingomonas sp. TaxID=28214 RepID=UPI001B006240|nr:carboxylesterase family protein [Sphingomonas sp.]MBO9713873.1 carboxylesterase family protein [Sphingomonas sp.]
MRGLGESLAAAAMAIGVAAMPGTAAAQAAAPVVKVEGGALSGSHQGGLDVFKGIPYAAPPVGNRRWRAPARAQPWAGTRPATEFGADCEHSRRDWEADRNGAPMSEDCLFLNVWAPAKAVKGGAPVMVWIHGGSFTAGSGSQAVYDGSALAARGAVVVTLNYRLGRFGFFAHPALTAEARGAPTGNWGLMDILAALRWVKRNARAFGGDPAKVTIFGESAGGGAVNAMMVSPLAKGLFQRAIVQSGGGRDRGGSLADAEAKGVAFARKYGVEGNDLAALRAIPADKVRGNMSLMNSESDTYSGAMADGQIVLGNLDDAWRSGRAAKVPYLVGSNSDEVAFLPAPLRAAAAAMAPGQLGEDAAAIKAAYGSDEAFKHAIVTDLGFGEPARFAATMNAANPSFLYRFDYVPEAAREPGTGAAHGGDVPFVFGTLGTLARPATDADRAMARAVGDYWVAFARDGVPDPKGLPAWPRFAPDGPMMVFGPAGPAVGSAASPALDAVARHNDKPAKPKP